MTIDTSGIDREIEAQKFAIANAERDLREKKERLHLLQLDRARILYGVTIGGIVKDKKGVEFRVVGIDSSWDWGWGAKPWIWGNQRRKDGTFGTAIRSLYSDWTAS